MLSINLSALRALPKEEEKELTTEHVQAIEKFIPILGPLFGLAVLLFHVWDHLIFPESAREALIVRVSLVVIGAFAYTKTRLPWSVVQRCCFIYWTHVSAIIISVFIAKSGFLYGLSGITTCVFIVAVMTYRFRIFFIVLSFPSILFIILNSLNQSHIEMINGFMMYTFAVVMASVALLIIRTFRQKNFLIQKKLLLLNRQDHLTGANNRAYISELAEHAFSLAKRHSRPLAISTLDIDFFKKVNDTYGHDVGDQVIQLLSKTCIAELRQIDHFGRMGGEEFVCVLPETTQDEAMLCMERLRIKIANLKLETSQGTLQFTISIGVAMLNERHEDWSSLLKDADIAMYAAKNSGRNQAKLAV